MNLRFYSTPIDAGDHYVLATDEDDEMANLILEKLSGRICYSETGLVSGETRMSLPQAIGGSLSNSSENRTIVEYSSRTDVRVLTWPGMILPRKATSLRRCPRRRTRCVVVLLLALVLGTGQSGMLSRLMATEPEKPRAVLRGNTIAILPLTATLSIPKGWLEWQAQFDNNIHLTPKELAAVRVADAEWDKEYAEIVNALVPFADCVAQAGGEGWGREAASYHDVQMRIYLVASCPRGVVARVGKGGPRLASQFSKKVSVARSTFDQWQRATLRYDLWYSDYGGTANIDVFSRAIGSRSVVLVFMYADSLQNPRRQIADIVKSFTWDQASGRRVQAPGPKP